MAKSWSLKIGAISLGTESAGQAAPRDPEAPFRILLLGNFRGHGRAAQAVAGRRPILVDRDNVDEVLARLGPELHLAWTDGRPPLAVRFTDIDSFHPDTLFQRLEVFAALRDLQDRLANPRTFAAAAAELRPQVAPASPAPRAPANVAALSPEQLLEQMLGGSAAGQEPAAAPPSQTAGDWQKYLQKIVQPHLTPNVDAEQEQLLDQVDQAISAQMRDLLHHPDFQALEAAWRAVDFLTRRLDTDTNLKLYLLDLSREELAEDLAADDPQASALYRLLVEQAVYTPGGQPWAVVAGNYIFDLAADEGSLLPRLAGLAAQAGAPFVAEANLDAALVSSARSLPEPESSWQGLRGLPEAAYLGLAWPRFLLRLPYGQDAAPTERFRFEEMPAEHAPPHASYLWGNPAFLCALLLGQAFSQNGWQMRPGQVEAVGDLPLHVYRDEGESAVHPCAEVILTDRMVTLLRERGIMPVVPMRDRDVVVLESLQSVADPMHTLAGPWQ